MSPDVAAAPGSPGSLDGRVAVVTGASSGIGLALAELVHERGAEVVLLARRGDVLREVAARLGPRVHALPTDIADRDSVRAAFDRIGAEHGRVDLVANVAGVQRYRLAEEYDDTDLDAVLGSTLLGTIHVTRAAIPLLRAAGGGDVLVFGSEVTQLYLPGSSVYSAAKAGLARYADVVGRELRPDGIRVTEVVVGYTATGASALIPQADRDRMRDRLVESGYQGFSGRTPMAARDVAEVGLFAATRPRSQYVGVVHARAMR